MNLRVVFQATLAIGAALAVVGGIAVGACHLADPSMEMLPRLETAWHRMLIGFAFLGGYAVASAVLDALARLPKPAPEPAPAPVASPAAPIPKVPVAGRLEAVYHEMKTYVDLEMWELALEKANAILKQFPGTREAELVERNLGELRWKAEPKYVGQATPITEDQERRLREKGLAAMYQHVKTYMDLEMWELARQKAVAIMKSFPDSPEAVELMKVFETIEKKAKEVPASP